MSTSLGYNINRTPIAQSFYNPLSYGCYVTKIDLFFEAKSSTDPVCLQLRPMVNGVPSTTEVIPQSTVYVNAAQVGISDDATIKTTFEFEEPVYLNGNTDYALVVSSTSKDYSIFISEVDKFLVGTTASRVIRNPVLGTLFYSADGGTFTASQNQDLTFVIHRASFTSLSGRVRLKNTNVPKKLLDPNPIQTLNNQSTVRVSDPGHGFLVNDPVFILGLDSSGSVGGIPNTNIMGGHTVTAVDWTGYEFTAASTASDSDVGGGNDVLVSKNIPWSAYYINQQTLIPEQTYVDPGMKATSHKSFAGTETAYQKDASFLSFQDNETMFTFKAHAVLSDSVAEDELGLGVASFELDNYFETEDSSVSPMIDLQRSSATLIDFLIDNQDSSATTGYNVPLEYVDEVSKVQGSAAAKHITRRFDLEEPAVGLKIIFAANKPSGSSFDVYYRTASQDENLSNKNFILTPTTSSNPVDDDFTLYREYEYLPGGLTGDLPEFNSFQLKIVMRAENRGTPPRFKDLRIIALSV
jgi:hypothetical protein